MKMQLGGMRLGILYRPGWNGQALKLLVLFVTGGRLCIPHVKPVALTGMFGKHGARRVVEEGVIGIAGKATELMDVLMVLEIMMEIERRWETEDDDERDNILNQVELQSSRQRIIQDCDPEG